MIQRALLAEQKSSPASLLHQVHKVKPAHCDSLPLCMDLESPWPVLGLQVRPLQSNNLFLLLYIPELCSVKMKTIARLL